jgi:hypothetical protein
MLTGAVVSYEEYKKANLTKSVFPTGKMLDVQLGHNPLIMGWDPHNVKSTPLEGYYKVN